MEEPRLLDLVVAKLQEDFPGHIIEYVYRQAYIPQKPNDSGENIYDFYINNTFMGEIYDNKAQLWIPVEEDLNLVTYHAGDPKFFTHVTQTCKMVMDWHYRVTEEHSRGSRGPSQYFTE